jgi:hypothetical protein
LSCAHCQILHPTLNFELIHHPTRHGQHAHKTFRTKRSKHESLLKTASLQSSRTHIAVYAKAITSFRCISAVERRNIYQAAAIPEKQSTMMPRYGSTRNAIIPTLIKTLLLGNLIYVALGVRNCLCSPSKYTFKINLTTICDPLTFEAPGVNYTGCWTDPPTAQPLFIDEIYIQEESETISYEQFYNGSFFDGDVIEYTSITAIGPNIPRRDLPIYMSFYLYGRDVNNTATQSEAYIQFSTECLNSTVYDTGVLIGLLEIVSCPPCHHCRAHKESVIFSHTVIPVD